MKLPQPIFKKNLPIISWNELVESLNNKYTSHLKKLAGYEKEFNENGKKYVNLAQQISKTDLKKINNKQLKEIFLNYQEKLFAYSVFAWTSFILNNYIADKATRILDSYIKKHRWLSCLDIHNKPWTREEFKKHLKSLGIVSKEKTKSFYNYIDDLNIRSDDLSYLKMAKRFVYIKDARDDFRRYGVFLASALFREIAKRIGIKREE